MKKLVTISVFFLLLSMSGMSQSTLPNGNFNDWYFAFHPTHAGGGFYEPGGGFFKTLNILDTILTPSGLTCYRTDTVHTGTYAAKLITKQIDAFVFVILIPGVVGTLSINWATLNATLGVPYTYSTRASSFQGWYQSYPVKGDSSGALVLLSKWNSAAHKRDTIGYKRLVFQGTVTDYTYFDTPIDYIDQVTMPDSITLLLFSSSGFNTLKMAASVGQVGSQALFDDITLTDVTGFQHLLMPEINVKVYPNPARSTLTVELEKPVKNGQFMVYSLDGKKLDVAPLSQFRNQVSVKSLLPGTYYYKVSDGKSILNTGSFIVKK